MFRIKVLVNLCFFYCGLLFITMPVFAQETADTSTVVPVTDTKNIDNQEALPIAHTDTPQTQDTTLSDEEELKNRETWLESLITQGANELFKSKDVESEEKEQKRLEKVLKNRRSNAALFDISQVKLRMTPAEVEAVLKPQGYIRISQEFRIPNFIRWRAEELCRIHSVIGFERLKACARDVAQTNGFEYIGSEVYKRHSTRETISVHYTSVFSNNLAHHIYYESDLPMSVSRASQYVYTNNLKIYDFWRRVDLRYGKPDNTSEVKWGLGGKKPFLKASTGRLELSDPVLKDLDAARMVNEDARLTNVPYYNF